MPKQIWDFIYENWKAVIVFGIITIGGIVFVASKQFGFTVATTITEKNVEIGNLTYDKFDGTKLEGSDVINAIKRHQKQLPVTVYTGESVDTYKGSFTAAGNDRKSEKYIRPSQVYYGSLQQDKNKEVIGLVFAKEGVQLKDPSYKEEIGNIVGGDAENSTMEELIKKLADTINGKDATLADLKKQLDALNSSMGNLQSEKTKLTNQINSLTSQLENETKKYNTLTSEVSSGKSLIANAITNKGVTTSASATFNTMAENIGKIGTSAELIKEEYTYSNNSIKTDESGIHLTVQAKNIIPEMVVISSEMEICGAWNIVHDKGMKTITATKYSQAYSFYSNENDDFSYQGRVNQGSIILNNNQAVIEIEPNNYVTGWYGLVTDGTTKVTLYGIKK